MPANPFSTSELTSDRARRWTHHPTTASADSGVPSALGRAKVWHRLDMGIVLADINRNKPGCRARKPQKSHRDVGRCLQAMTGPGTLCPDGTVASSIRPSPCRIQLVTLSHRHCSGIANTHRDPAPKHPKSGTSRFQNLASMTPHKVVRRLPYALHRPTCTVPTGYFGRLRRKKPISRKGMEYIGHLVAFNRRHPGVIRRNSRRQTGIPGGGRLLQRLARPTPC